MQSADGDVHLLPAVPDEWTSGRVKGLRARGGFEIVSIEWKDSKLIKAVIRSTIAGNLRLRVPNEMKSSNGAVLKKATGKNINAFFQVEETPPPIISEKVKITPLEVKKTFLYDLATQAGETYTFVYL
jgi:alpha-L-fucosidase 2